MAFAFTVLGSSAMYGTKERACSGYLLALDEARIWVDAGAGSWRNLVRHTDFRTLDGVVLSHRHPDHTSDLPQAFHARQYGGPTPCPPLPVWAPGETIERLVDYSKESTEGLDFRTIAENVETDIGGARFSFVRMAHPAETLGMRIEHSGKVLAYSADTGPAADFDAMVAGADVFLCEATFQDSDGGWEGHISASQAGGIAARVGAGWLILTHLPPGRDLELSLAEARRESGDVPVELAYDGMRVELAP